MGMNTRSRRSAGVVERDGLENRCGGDSTQGSNPCSSAIAQFHEIQAYWEGAQRYIKESS